MDAVLSRAPAEPGGKCGLECQRTDGVAACSEISRSGSDGRLGVRRFSGTRPGFRLFRWGIRRGPFLFSCNELVQFDNSVFETVVRCLVALEILGATKGHMSVYDVEQEIRFPAVMLALCLVVSHHSRCRESFPDGL